MVASWCWWCCVWFRLWQGGVCGSGVVAAGGGRLLLVDPKC